MPSVSFERAVCVCAHCHQTPMGFVRLFGCLGKRGEGLVFGAPHPQILTHVSSKCLAPDESPLLLNETVRNVSFGPACNIFARRSLHLFIFRLLDVARYYLVFFRPPMTRIPVFSRGTQDKNTRKRRHTCHHVGLENEPPGWEFCQNLLVFFSFSDSLAFSVPPLSGMNESGLSFPPPLF